MPDPNLNLVPVIIAGVINMILGALWYSPLVTGKLWMRSMGKTEEELKQGFSSSAMGMTYVVNTIASLVFAYVLHIWSNSAWLTRFPRAYDRLLGLAWLCSHNGHSGYMYERPKMLFILFIIYQLISITLMGGFLAIW
jgi:hypothetical protein